MAGLSNIFGGDYDDDSVDGQEPKLDAADPEEEGVQGDSAAHSDNGLIGTAGDGDTMSDEASE